MAEQRFLVVGKNGWIGQLLAAMLEKEGAQWKYADFRLEYRSAMEAELDSFKPTHVLNCAGVTGRPNVDWCEDHKAETVRSNVIGCLNLIDACCLRNIHVTNLGTGCVYHYSDSHPIGGKPFTEEDEPNFMGSYYSRTKAMVEEVIRDYPNVLHLRLRMPISDDLGPRNFITKISKYEKVVNIPNSMTILTELLPAALDMTKRNLKGIFNFTNPGAISHNEVLELYKKYIDPDFTWSNFSLDEQAKILKAGRSNCELDSSKLLAANPGAHIQPVKQAMEDVFKRMAINMGKSA
jgi:3,5-epimerase/4-reductase